MTSLLARLAQGFAAGAFAHALFQGTLGFALHHFGLRAAAVWSISPVGPFAVPATLNAMFWDGLWGLVYGAAAPKLVAAVGRVGSGVVLASGSLLVYWFLVLPLKGANFDDVFALEPLLDSLMFDLVFGLGTAFLYSIQTRAASINRR